MNRLKQGYGLNKEAIKQIVDKGCTLMITVDCGISGIEDVDYANSLGIDTIITDHHEPLEVLPKGLAVVDPKIEESEWMQYCLDENAFNSLKDFLDDNITGHPFDRERQIRAFSRINADTQGTCGRNVYNFVKGKVT